MVMQSAIIYVVLHSSKVLGITNQTKDQEAS